MIIGCPKEIKSGETRTALTPAWAKTLVEQGHTVLVQSEGALACGFSDSDYLSAGAIVEKDIASVYKKADFIVKCKELMREEYGMLRKDQIVMAWFHLAEDVDHDMLNAMLDSKCIGLGMELIVLPDGTRPTIKPMSEIAGSLAMLEAVKYGQFAHGGRGILFKKISGLPAASVVLLGGGHAGLCAADVAIGLGLKVTIIEKFWKRIAELRYMAPKADVIYWEDAPVHEALLGADVLINTLYTQPNQPCLISREMVKKMKKDVVMIDIAGCGVIETMHYTTLADPIYYEEGILHYNVPNMPALCPRTSTQALLLASGPYIEAIANKGLKKAFADDPCLKKSICTLDGKVVHDEAALNHNMAATPFELSMLS